MKADGSSLAWSALTPGQALVGTLTKVAASGVRQELWGEAGVLRHLHPLSAVQGHPVSALEGRGHHKWHTWWPVQRQGDNTWVASEPCGLGALSPEALNVRGWRKRNQWGPGGGKSTILWPCTTLPDPVHRTAGNAAVVRWRSGTASAVSLPVRPLTTGL